VNVPREGQLIKSNFRFGSNKNLVVDFHPKIMRTVWVDGWKWVFKENLNECASTSYIIVGIKTRRWNECPNVPFDYVTREWNKQIWSFDALKCSMTRGTSKREEDKEEATHKKKILKILALGWFLKRKPKFCLITYFPWK